MSRLLTLLLFFYEQHLTLIVKWPQYKCQNAAAQLHLDLFPTTLKPDIQQATPQKLKQSNYSTNSTKPNIKTGFDAHVFF